METGNFLLAERKEGGKKRKRKKKRKNVVRSEIARSGDKKVASRIHRFLQGKKITICSWWWRRLIGQFAVNFPGAEVCFAICRRLERKSRGRKLFGSWLDIERDRGLSKLSLPPCQAFYVRSLTRENSRGGNALEEIGRSNFNRTNLGDVTYPRIE